MERLDNSPYRVLVSLPGEIVRARVVESPSVFLLSGKGLRLTFFGGPVKEEVRRLRGVLLQSTLGVYPDCGGRTGGSPSPP